MTEIQVPEWLIRLADHFVQHGAEFFVVGGAIRNQLLGRAVEEWDAATNARPEQIEQLLRAFGVRQLATVGKRFGTIAATIEHEPIEITTYRSEQYRDDSRQPTVSFGQSLQQDLARRDFTINALAFEPKNSRLLDPFNGQNDLAAKVIKSVGRAAERFNEDPLRILRAIRLAAQLDFQIEPATVAAIQAERSRLALLSAERVQQELTKILLAEQPSQAIEQLVDLGLINYILPELLPSINLDFDRREHKDIYHHILQVLDQTPPELELRWTALLHDIAKPQTRRKIGNEYHFLGHEVLGAKIARQVLRRLEYPKSLVEDVAKLVYLHQRIPNDDGQWTDGAVRRFVRDAGHLLNDLFTFAEADSTGNNQTKISHYAAQRAKLQARIAELEKQAAIAKIKSPLSGEELMTLFNRPPGPWIKPLKEKLLALVLDGELTPDDKAQATQVAKDLLKKLPESGQPKEM